MYFDKDVHNLIISYKNDIENYEKNKKIIFDIFKSNDYLEYEILLSFIIFKDILIENKFNNYNLIKYVYINRLLHYSYIEDGILLDLKFKYLYNSNIVKIIKDEKNDVIIYLEEIE